MFNGRDFLKAPAGALLPSAKPPNIIFILADELGWGDLGCHGHPNIRTPSLDRLARQGIQLWSLLPHATLDPLPEQLETYSRLAPGGQVPHNSATQIYYASVSSLDRAIGRLPGRLDELGLADNTLVFFSSDNGPEDIHIRNAGHSGAGSSGPFRGRKRSLYAGGIRLPFLVRWPGRVPVRRVDDASVLTAVDFLPAVAKFAGLELPPDLKPDGEDASDILLGKSRPRTKSILWEWRFHIFGDSLNRSPILAIREGDWKLLRNPDRSRVELYNIPRHPSELHNLAADHPEIVERLSKAVLAWQKTLPEGPFDKSAGRNDYPWPRPR